MIGRAAWLLVRLRLRRLANQLGSGFRRKRPSRPGARQATVPRARGAALAVVMALIMGGYGVSISGMTVRHVYGQLSSARDVAQASHAPGSYERALSEEQFRRHVGRLSPPKGPALFEPGVRDGLTLVLTLIVGAALLMSLGTKELAAPEWDMEWLVTLPLPRSTLLLVRLVERTFVSPTAVLFVVPFVSVLAWYRGAGWLSAPVGLAVALPLLLLIGALRLLVDTGVRVVLDPARLRNLQAVISILGLVLLYLALATGVSRESFIFGWARHVPEAAHWLPTGLAVSVFASADALSALLPLALLCAEAAGAATLVLFVLHRLLRRGVVASGGRESGRRAAPAATAPRGARRWLTPIQARELKLLARDRNFLVQTLVLPVVIIGAQFLFNTRLFDTLGEQPAHVAAMAFGLSAYVLMFSAFQTLNAEGHALWLLYTFPQPLDVVLRQKARLWSVITLIYPLAVMGLLLRPPYTWDTAGLVVAVLAGVAIYATLAVCIGVWGSNPLAQEQNKRVRPGYVYLFMLLVSLYTYAIYATSLWPRIAMMTLCAALALALWQQVRTRLPYLLDPSAQPPSQVSLADGLVAALVFFVLQGAFLLIAADGREPTPSGAELLAVYAVAGALTWIGVRCVYWARGTRGVPQTFGGPLRPQLGHGLLAGAAAGAAGLAYIALAPFFPQLEEALRRGSIAGGEHVPWLAALAIVAAPLFEEFVFRGLIFRGLRRSFGLWGSVAASAAIFAVCHPPAALLPVFCLGVMTALAYEATGLLLAPMLAHGLYNAAVLFGPYLWS
jgi:ABC-2 type transport system permease protein